MLLPKCFKNIRFIKSLVCFPPLPWTCLFHWSTPHNFCTRFRRRPLKKPCMLRRHLTECRPYRTEALCRGYSSSITSAHLQPEGAASASSKIVLPASKSCIPFLALARVFYYSDSPPIVVCSFKIFVNQRFRLLISLRAYSTLIHVFILYSLFEIWRIIS